MPKVRELSISISQGPVYFSGQIIQGHVTLDLEQPMTMRGLRLHVNGEANVFWTERHRSGKTTRIVHYRSSESYINNIFVLFGKGPHESGENKDHPAGKFTYPFQFQIPPSAPSSFESTTGQVRYLLTAVIDKPWKFNHVSKTAFTVVSLLDLNKEPNLLNEITFQNSKTICCLCCKSGPITAVFKLNRQCYVPGEFVPCFAEINNGSTRNIVNSYFKLKQVMYFKTSRKTRREERVLHSLRKGEIAPGDSDYWQGETMQLPPIPPSRLDGCNIIDIVYFMSLVVVPSGLAFDLIVDIPIVVGSIPHWSVVQQYVPQFSPPSSYGAPGTEANAPPVSFPEGLPPPEYGAGVGDKVNIRGEEDTEYTRGNLEFSPIYPCYNWGTAHTSNDVTAQGYQGEEEPKDQEG